jgi:ABC-type antimicrobial peptide transport system permease subunit
VIGIVEDAKFASLREPAPRTLYYPVAADLRDNVANLVFLMNADTKKRAMDGYRQALREIAPTVPVVLFATLRDQMDAALGIERLITLLSSVFAGLALFLSAIGLYGLLSSHVAQRAGEIGIRIALGAQRNSVLRLILSEALRLTGIGSLFGGIGLFFAFGFVQKMLFGVSGFEPVLLSGNLALLLAVTLLAAIPPALRAASIDPTRTIQTD